MSHLVQIKLHVCASLVLNGTDRLTASDLLHSLLERFFGQSGLTFYRLADEVSHLLAGTALHALDKLGSLLGTLGEVATGRCPLKVADVLTWVWCGVLVGQVQPARLQPLISLPLELA